MSDDRVETHVVCTPPGEDRARAIHFQEWWVRYRAQVPTTGFVQVGLEQAKGSPEALAALAAADVVVGKVVRPADPRLTVFKPMGMGLSDLAVAGLLTGALTGVRP